MNYTDYNSSFTECVRKHIKNHSILIRQSHPSNTQLSTPPFTDPTLTSQNEFTDRIFSHLTLSFSSSFTSCEWKNCEASDGGAICLDGDSLSSLPSSLSLSVERCTFSYCVCTGVYGGAIFMWRGTAFSAEHSFIIGCASKEADGGGFQICHISQCTHLSHCTFIDNHAYDYGGGFCTYNR